MEQGRKTKELGRMLGFASAYESYHSGTISCSEAGFLLGMSERSFRRWKHRYEEFGEDGLRDNRVGKVSPRRGLDSEAQLINNLYRERYRGFNVRHYHHFLVENHGLGRSYSFVKRTLEKEGLITKSKRGGDHRLRRERKAMAGMMIHQDASTHNWFGEENCDLVVTLDDATSEITSAFFCEQEGTFSSMRGISETIEKNGLFCSFYTDRGSHYWYTPIAGAKVSKHQLTEVGRALKQLGIIHIAAYSPQARGRSERMFGTLQDRLVNELKLHHINDMESANKYLIDKYLPAHNKQFMVKAKEEKTAYLPYTGRAIYDILSLQESRKVNNDNTVQYNNLKLQIPKDNNRHHYVKCEVTIHHYPDDTMAIFYGHKCLAKYAKNGMRISEVDRKIAA